MNDLLKKDQKFECTEECQRAFDDLKKQFTGEPVLMMPDQTRPFQIKTDASKYAAGAVLEWQQTPNIIYIKNLFTSRMKL